MQLLSNQVKFSSCAAGLILFLFSAASLFAEDRATTGSAKSLAAAETAFAQESVEKGMRSAFSMCSPTTASFFCPDRRTARRHRESKPASEAVLQWHPVLAATSTSGDLGYTTGPGRSQKAPTNKEPTDFGHFVSIWRWENGKWKLLFDLGSDHPRPAGPSPELQLVENHAPHESPVTALPSMLALDRSYASDRVRHFSSVAEDLIRVYPPQEFPVTGREAAAAALAGAPKPITFGEPKGEVSQGGDFGICLGRISARRQPGDYLRIWRKNRAGNWKLALELLHPR